MCQCDFKIFDSYIIHCLVARLRGECVNKDL
jgi:hypothetical protein